MEQEETYIPYKERTPKELCGDIIIKAEKLYLKHDKLGLLVFAVALIVCAALIWHFKKFYEWWFGYTVLVAFVAAYFVFFKIIHKMMNEMNLAASPKQFLPIAQRLKKCVWYRNFVCETLCYWLLTAGFMPYLKDLWWWYPVSFILALLIALLVVKIRPISEKEAALYDDMYDLERMLRE